MYWEWINIIDRWIWTKEFVIWLLNILDIESTHMGGFPKFCHIWLQAILRHWMKKCRSEAKNPLAASRLTLQQYGIQLPETESKVKGLMKEVSRQQENTLMMTLRGKSIHGAHHKTLEGDGIDQCTVDCTKNFTYCDHSTIMIRSAIRC